MYPIPSHSIQSTCMCRESSPAPDRQTPGFQPPAGKGEHFYRIEFYVYTLQQSYHVLVRCAFDWRAWKKCTWSCEATLWKCWISNGMDIIHSQLTGSNIVICLPKRKTSLAPGRTGLPQVDLTTFLAACNKFDWDFDYLFLWRHPSYLVWYCAGDQSH